MAEAFDDILNKNRNLARQRISSALNPEVRDSNIGVFIDLLSQNYHALQITTDNARRDAWVGTAEGTRLDEFGETFNVARNLGGLAKGSISITSGVASVIPKNTKVIRNDGLIYLTLEEINYTGGNAVLFIVAENDGVEYNADPGTAFSIVVNNNTYNTTNTEAIAGGLSRDNDELYRRRIIQAIRRPESGGTKNDWRRWTVNYPYKEVTSVSVLQTGVGEVTIYPTIAGNTNNIPTDTDITGIRNWLDDFRPLGINLLVKKATARVVPITFSELESNDSVVQTNITEALNEVFADRAKVGETFRLSWLTEAISNAIGESYHTLTTPTSDITVVAGQLAVLGVITYPDRS